MTLLGFLNQNYSLAKAYTKKFHDEVKEAIRDYEAEPAVKKNGVHDKHVATKGRYDITIPYIFATHESMLASLFEKLPEIVITGRTSENVDDANILKALYDYIIDMCDLDEFLETSMWWFILAGFAVSNAEYKVEQDGEAPQLNANGEPMVDEMGEPIMIPTYSYHDPVVHVENLLKVYFSPDSEFSVDGKKIPHLYTESLMEPEEVESIWGKEVEADEEIEVDGLSEDKDKNVLKRCRVMRFYGRVSKECGEYLQEYDLEWKFGKEYKIIFTKDTILYAEEREKPQRFVKLYGALNKFFGYGIAKTLKPFQDDMSVRRSQQLRYADMFAFPWLLLDSAGTYDQKSIEDYRKKKPLTYTEKKPEYLVPPNMPDSIMKADEASRSDAQFVSGTLDLSSGAQDTNTVETATGQQLFAQGQDKRTNKMRKSIAKYYREVVIQLFKLCRDNWDGHKELTYVSEDGEQQELLVSADDLRRIDFDTDVDFNLDSVSVNQDILSQRWISLLEKVPDLPYADGRKIYQKALRESFKIQNPENYTVDEQQEMINAGMQPGAPAQPMESPEEVPAEQPQTMGSQLAPQPY